MLSATRSSDVITPRETNGCNSVLANQRVTFSLSEEISFTARYICDLQTFSYEITFTAPMQGHYSVHAIIKFYYPTGNVPVVDNNIHYDAYSKLQDLYYTL